MSEILKPLTDVSKTLNGYVELPGGLILQWGENTHLSGGQSVTANFPIPFPNACLRAVGGGFTSGTTGYDAHVRTVTATQITTWSAEGRNVSWIAIGH